MNITKLPLFLLGSLLFLPTLHADEAPVEYKIKAGYLYNFTKFITWPSDDNAKTFNLCLLGDDPFGDLINPIEQRNALGLPIKLIRLDRLTGQARCHIVYISSLKNLPSVNAFTATLTVGEGKEFAEQGGMIGFENKEGRIKLQVNLQAIKKNSLKISAKLLEVSEIIGGEGHD
ncbi:MAG: YfiR family protein [Methylovulum sp.]|nr:YfiR family protein [Methylovulum sp.]